MPEHLDLVDQLYQWLEDLPDDERESLDPVMLAQRMPEVAALSDEDIHLVAESFLSRVDYGESPVRRIHDLLTAARAAAKGRP